MQVPTVAAPHFMIDFHTLFAVTVFISATAGVLLLFAWLQNRRTTALAWWGIGYLFGAAAAALLAAPPLLPSGRSLLRRQRAPLQRLGHDVGGRAFV